MTTQVFLDKWTIEFSNTPVKIFSTSKLLEFTNDIAVLDSDSIGVIGTTYSNLITLIDMKSPDDSVWANKTTNAGVVTTVKLL